MNSKKTIYRSDNRSGVVQRIRKTLLNVELQCVRAKAEIDVRKEIIAFHSASTKKADVTAVIVAKVEKENYETFLKRMTEIKNTLTANIELIAKKYEGKYSDVFMQHYFRDLSISEISQNTGLTPKQVSNIIWTIKQDLIAYYNEKKEGN